MKTYQVSGALLQAIINSLAKLPYQDSVDLINEILKLNEQHPAEAAPAEETTSEAAAQ